MAGTKPQNHPTPMPTPNPVRSALEALLDSPGNRSAMARFRDIAGDIDRLVRAGVKRAAIIKTLAEHGLELTPAQLKSYLERWRAEQLKLTGRPLSEPEPGPAPTPAPAATPASQSRSTPPQQANAEPPPRTGRTDRSIREIRTAEVDFAGAERWYREQRKAGKG